MMLAVTIAALIALPGCKPKPAAPKGVVVTYLKGTATAGGTKVAVGTLLTARQVLKTGQGSVIDLAAGDEIAIRLLGNSQFSIAEILRQKVRVRVADGNILVKVGKLRRDRSVSVVTPTAIASVRGTQFWGQVKKGDSSGVFAVREGSVSVKLHKSGQELVVNKGEAVQIAPGARGMKKRKALAAEMGAMQQIDQIKFAGK